MPSDVNLRVAMAYVGAFLVTAATMVILTSV